MNEKFNKELLEKLSSAFGPSGCEAEVVSLIKDTVGKYADEIIEDTLGNLIIKINGKTDKKLMMCAHTDEVGFMVRAFDDHGCIYFHTVGGISCGALCARSVTVKGKDGKKYPGVIDSKAIHSQSAKERKEYIPTDKMHINIGAKDEKEVRELVSLGDFAVFDSDFVLFGNGFVKGKALDDRVGCAVMCDIIKKLKEENKTPESTVYFAFTTKEEVGRSGALTATELIKPDFALILECTAVSDMPDTPAHKTVSKLGDGVSLSLMDNSTVYRKEVIEKMMATAEKENVKYQIKTFVSGGNDAGHIHKTSGGVRCATLSVPSRYIHSACCVIHEDDYASMLDFAYATLFSNELTNMESM